MLENLSQNMNDRGKLPEQIYCVFCRAGSEENTASLINSRLGCRAIVPRVIRDECHSGIWEKKVRVMLPGYIFVYSDTAVSLDGVGEGGGMLKLLRYGENDNELRGNDLEFAEWIYDNDGTIGLSTAVKEGSKIRVVGGPLLNYSGSIVEVKRQKRLAKVSITIGDTVRDVWMSFEWLQNQ